MKTLLQGLEVYFVLAFCCLGIGALVGVLIALTSFDYRRKFRVSLADWLRHPFREWQLLSIWRAEQNYRNLPPRLRSSLPEHRLRQMWNDQEEFAKWRDEQEHRDLVSTFGETLEDRINGIQDDIQRAGK
jgi:hypothetical protein